jgi:hypothetical protein
MLYTIDESIMDLSRLGIDTPLSLHYFVPILSGLMILLLFLAHPGFATSTLSTPYNKTSFENLEIIKVISFNNTSLSSIAVDPVSDLVYVSQTRLLFQLFAYFMLGAECYWFCDCLEFHVSVFCYLYS